MSEAKYKVIFDTDLEKLTAEVSKHLDDGWELCGGIAMAHSPGDPMSWEYDLVIYFAQALRRE